MHSALKLHVFKTTFETKSWMKAFLSKLKDFCAGILFHKDWCSFWMPNLNSLMTYQRKNITGIYLQILISCETVKNSKWFFSCKIAVSSIWWISFGSCEFNQNYCFCCWNMSTRPQKVNQPSGKYIYTSLTFLSIPFLLPTFIPYNDNISKSEWKIC